MLKTLFKDQKAYLNQFFDEIDLAEAQIILGKLIECKGSIVLTGVGKSGHIAEKISATFSSTGTRSFFLHPANALHGDIGRLSEKDLLLVLSKSGNSQELIDLMPHVKKKGALSIGVLSNSHSKLFQMCDLSIILPVDKEICPYNLAPTTSTAAQLIFCDCLAIALMQSKEFSLQDFALNHPGGSLGRKISFKVTDLMLKASQLPLCFPKDLLMNVLHELSIKRCGCLLVKDEEGKLKGIFTDGDMRRAIESKGVQALSMAIGDLMTKSFKYIGPDQLAFEAVKVMEEDSEKLITVLPVLDQGKIIGLIRMHDILQKELT